MKATFDAESIAELTELRPGETFGGRTVVASEYVGDWRWGTIKRLIFTDKLGDYWSFRYRKSDSDAEWNWVEDEGDTVECTRVYPHIRTITTYTTEENT